MIGNVLFYIFILNTARQKTNLSVEGSHLTFVQNETSLTERHKGKDIKEKMCITNVHSNVNNQVNFGQLSNLSL